MKQVFSQEEQHDFLSNGLAAVSFASSESLLGKGEAFEYALYDHEQAGGEWPAIAPQLDSIVRRLAKQVPHLRFNTMWLQRYLTGGFIRPHTDPRSYLGVVVIGVFGNFTGGQLAVGEKLQPVDNVEAGDVVLLLANTEARYTMPLHAVSQVESGERVVVILNAKQWHDKGFSCTGNILALRKTAVILLAAVVVLFLAYQLTRFFS